MLSCVGLVLIFSVTDYMALSYLPSYLWPLLHFNESHGLFIVLLVMVLMMPATLAAGRLSDAIGRKPVMLFGCVGLFALSIPALLLIRMGTLLPVFSGLMILGVLLSCFTGVMPSALPALFPTKIRYGALAIGFNVSVSLFGGTTPLVTAWLVDRTGNLMMPGVLPDGRVADRHRVGCRAARNGTQAAARLGPMRGDARGSARRAARRTRSGGDGRRLCRDRYGACVI